MPRYDQARWKAYWEKNKETLRAKNRIKKRRYDKENPEKAYAIQIKSKYGITLDEYKQMLTDQDNQCAICKSASPGGSSKTRFCVDHCHIKGTVRGLLCSKCNLAISYLDDNPETLLAAIKYLTGDSSTRRVTREE